MQSLRLRIDASTAGKPLRPVAIGIWHDNGVAEFPSVADDEELPSELLQALDKYLETFHPTNGSWTHKIGDTEYSVTFEQHPTLN